MNAEHLAREIANEIMKSDPRILHSQIHRIRDIIAAHLAPLVSDAEKYRKLMEINDRMQKCMGYDD